MREASVARLAPAFLTVLVVAGCVLGGCVLEGVPFDRLRCPCGEGYVCDEAVGLCVERGASVCGRSLARPSPIEVTRFERWWVTAHQARLRWELSATSATVSALAVDIAPSASALASGAFDTIDGSQNPELARALLPGTDSPERVDSTVLRDLQPDTAYALRLVVTDDAGAIACSAPLSIRTNLAPRESLAVFEDALPPGSFLRIPCSELVEDAARAQSGGAFIAHRYRCERQEIDGMPVNVSVCTEPAQRAPECWENVGILGASLDVRAISAGDFGAAYLEAWVAIDDVSSAFWAELALTIDGAFYEIAQITMIGDGTFRRYEIPLSAFLRRCDPGSPECRAGVPLDRELLGDALAGARIGMALSEGATLRLDSIRIRW